MSAEVAELLKKAAKEERSFSFFGLKNPTENATNIAVAAFKKARSVKDYDGAVEAGNMLVRLYSASEPHESLSIKKELVKIHGWRGDSIRRNGLLRELADYYRDDGNDSMRLQYLKELIETDENALDEMLDVDALSKNDRLKYSTEKITRLVERKDFERALRVADEAFRLGSDRTDLLFAYLGRRLFLVRQLLCLAMMDAEEMAEAGPRLAEEMKSFGRSSELSFLEAVVESISTLDVEEFASLCAERDDVVRLSAAELKLLNAIKYRMEAPPSLA